MNISGLGKGSQFAYFSLSNDTDNKTTSEATLRMEKKKDKLVEENKSKKEETSKVVENRKKEEARLKSETDKKLADSYNKLTDKAKDYVKDLKAKNKDIDIYVADSVSNREAGEIMSKSAKSSSVLIDSKTTEKMAGDETVAKKYEDIISDTSKKLDSLFKEMNDKGVNVKAVGMNIDDEGKESYYGIVDESLSYYEKELKEQEAKDEKRAQERKEAQKLENEKKEKKREELNEARLEEMQAQEEEREEMMKEQLSAQFSLVTADSIEELKNKIGQTEDKVSTLKKSAIPVGAGIDIMA